MYHDIIKYLKQNLCRKKYMKEELINSSFVILSDVSKHSESTVQNKIVNIDELKRIASQLKKKQTIDEDKDKIIDLR